MNLNSNTALIVLLGVVLVVLVIYLNQDDPIHNDGALPHPSEFGRKTRKLKRPVTPENLETRREDDIHGDLVDDIILQYGTEEGVGGDGVGTFSPSVSRKNKDVNYGKFDSYGKKKQLNYRHMERPFDDYDDRFDPRDFSYKKKKFTKRTPEDVKELFDVHKMLPQQIEQNWFDAEPLLHTKKIKGTHLLHPKVHMGVNTVQSSLRNASHDIRGEPKNPKIYVSPWLESTIEPDTNLKGICNPI